METKFNFNSQVCTSKVQSERLLALGLKKETADCVHRFLNRWDGYCIEENDWSERMYSIEHIPAWSLHRIVSLCNTDNIKIAFNEKDCWGGNIKKLIERKSFQVHYNLYDNIIDCIEWLIKEGYFNKEYLINQAEVDEHCKGVLEYLDYIRGEEE